MFAGERFTQLREDARAAARKAATRATERATEFLQNPSTKRTATYAGGVLLTAAAIGLAARGLKKDSRMRTEIRGVKKDLRDKVGPAVRDSATKMRKVWEDTVAPALREEAANLKTEVKTAVREIFDARRQRRQPAEPSRAEPASTTV
jgi:hypothetical protein